MRRHDDHLDGVIEVSFHFSVILLLVLLNGFFVASEFSIVKVRNTRINELRQKGIQKAKLAQKVVNQMDEYLSATQLGITLSSLALGWIGEPYIAHLITPLLHQVGLPLFLINTVSFGISFAAITFLHIVLGEITPKSLAIRQAEKVTLLIARPLHIFYILFNPFIVVLNKTANLILKKMNITVSSETAHTEEEIRLLLAQSHKSGIIDQTKLVLYDNIFDFTDRIVREVMVPRVNMFCLFIDRTFKENLSVITESQHTRFPLCGADKDDIIGIVHIRDVYERLVENDVPELINIARTPISVPETMEVKDVLRNMQKKRMEMAIVVDEFGGTAGLVTTEDIIEEIFGEIQDEFDDEQPFILSLGSDTSINTRLLIDEVNNYFQINIDDPDNDTIGGWVFSQLKKIPKKGDYIVSNGLRFIVLEVDQRRVTRLLVKQEELSPKIIKI